MKQVINALRELERCTSQYLAGEIVTFPAALLPQVREVLNDETVKARAADSSPDRVHVPAFACSCHVVFSGKAYAIKYCPLHRAAPDLLKCCQLAAVRLEGGTSKEVEFNAGIACELRAAIGKALQS